jgi:hypothetical protein
VSRHELFPIRAPLLALEHCIQPFLDGCDADNDHFITLQEWGTCLELTEVWIITPCFFKKREKINIWISIKLQEEIEDKCDDVRDEAENGL